MDATGQLTRVGSSQENYKSHEYKRTFNYFICVKNKNFIGDRSAGCIEAVDCVGERNMPGLV